MYVTLTPEAEVALASLMNGDATAEKIVERALQHELHRVADLAAIREGLDDIEAGRTFSVDDFGE